MTVKRDTSPWSVEDERLLRLMRLDGVTRVEQAKRLNRSLSAVDQHATRLGLTQNRLITRPKVIAPYAGYVEQPVDDSPYVDACRAEGGFPVRLVIKGRTYDVRAA